MFPFPSMHAFNGSGMLFTLWLMSPCETWFHPSKSILLWWRRPNEGIYLTAVWLAASSFQWGLDRWMMGSWNNDRDRSSPSTYERCFVCLAHDLNHRLPSKRNHGRLSILVWLWGPEFDQYRLVDSFCRWCCPAHDKNAYLTWNCVLRPPSNDNVFLSLSAGSRSSWMQLWQFILIIENNINYKFNIQNFIIYLIFLFLIIL